MSNTEILAEVIDLLRNRGVDIDSPYDLENWMEDYASHEQQFATGKFNHLIEDNETTTLERL